MKKMYVRPLDFKNGRIEMSFGGGGRATAQLIDELFLPAFDNPILRQLNDSAVFHCPPDHRMVVATDSHVVTPLFFPGGDIGSLAVHGTINDVAMSGARPILLTAAFIIEEGFPLSDLKRVVASMAHAASSAGVVIAAGDTKVVEQGQCDGVYITTTGLGYLPAHLRISGDRARPGDKIILSGTVGDHGMAILSLREHLHFESGLHSDSAALHELVAAMLQSGADIRCLRDPTRGGVATALNEIARQSAVGMRIEEGAIPMREEVKGACEFLGLDPLYVANEGKLVAVCAPQHAGGLVRAMREHALGRQAAVIGEVCRDDNGFVEMQTVFGGTRIVDWLTGEQLPRIC